MEQRDYAIAGMLCLSAFLFRMFFWHYERVMLGDGVFYTLPGYNLLHGAGFTEMGGRFAYFARPLYPLYVGLVNFWTEDLLKAAKIVSSLHASLALALVYWLTCQIFSRRAAAYAALMMALSHILVKYSIIAMLEVNFAFYLLAMACVGYRFFFGENSNWTAAGLGIAAGMAGQVKEEALAILVVLLLYYVVLYGRTRRLVEVLRPVALALFICLLIHVPFWIYMDKSLGSFSISPKSGFGYYHTASLLQAENFSLPLEEYEKGIYGFVGETLEVATSVKGLEILSDKYSLATVLQAYPVEFAYFYFANIYQIFRKILFQTLPFPVLILAGVGLVGRALDGEYLKRIVYLLCFHVVFLLILPAFHFHSRRFVPYVPFAMVWAGNGAAIVAGWWGDLELNSKGSHVLFRRSAPLLFGILLAVFLGLQTYFEMRTSGGTADYALAYKETGEWMKAQHMSGTIMGTRHRQIAFYANCRWEPFPFTEDVERLKAYVEEKKIRYWAVDSDMVERRYPSYVGRLYEGARVFPWMRFIRRFEKQGTKVTIGEIDQSYFVSD